MSRRNENTRTYPRGTVGGGASRRRGATTHASASRDSKADTKDRRRSETSAKERRGARADAVRDKPTGVKRTGGGNYTTYRKDSAPAKNFQEAFAKAKREGKKTFTWRNRRYTTETA